MTHKNDVWLINMTHSKYLQSANVILTSFLWFSLLQSFTLSIFGSIPMSHLFFSRAHWSIHSILCGLHSKIENFREKYFRNVLVPEKEFENDWNRRGREIFTGGEKGSGRPGYEILKLSKFLWNYINWWKMLKYLKCLLRC